MINVTSTSISASLITIRACLVARACLVVCFCLVICFCSLFWACSSQNRPVNCLKTCYKVPVLNKIEKNSEKRSIGAQQRQQEQAAGPCSRQRRAWSGHRPRGTRRRGRGRRKRSWMGGLGGCLGLFGGCLGVVWGCLEMKLADIDVLVTFIKVWGSESTG